MSSGLHRFDWVPSCRKLSSSHYGPGLSGHHLSVLDVGR